MNNNQNICGNCKNHGKVDNGIVVIPCSCCACDNGYEWNGRRCYGVCGLGDPDDPGRESTLEELVAVHVLIVRPRYLNHIPHDLNGRTIDEYILDNFIPDEGKSIYKEMVESA